jgi:hypothetical protein
MRKYPNDISFFFYPKNGNRTVTSSPSPSRLSERNLLSGSEVFGNLRSIKSMFVNSKLPRSWTLVEIIFVTSTSDPVLRSWVLMIKNCTTLQWEKFHYVYLVVSSHKGLSSHKRRLQFSRDNSQHFNKRHNFFFNIAFPNPDPNTCHEIGFW